MSYPTIDAVIGHTPLVALPRFAQAAGAYGVVLAKLEGQNPAGSAKDRAALSMIRAAEADGSLQPGGTIVEPTSGNTGIAIAALATALGYQAILTMPDTMSVKRRQLLEAYGAKLVLTPGKDGMAGAIAKAEAFSQEIPGAVILGQFDNPANPRAHYETTGPEIWAQTGGSLAAFVAGAGTGGTVSGVGRYFKEQRKAVHVVAVEPKTSAVLSGGKPGAHGLQGIGAGFVPKNFDRSVVDEIFPVLDDEGYGMARLLSSTEGILTGPSGGAALFAAVQLTRRPEFQGKTVVVLLPDRGERYLSTGMFG